MGERELKAVEEREGTTQILTVIRDSIKDTRDDMREVRKDVKHQGEQIAAISRIQKVQYGEIQQVQSKVEDVIQAHAQCPSPKDVALLEKRVSKLDELSRKPSRRTPADGFKIQVQTEGIWKKLLPYIILAAIGGTGWAAHFFDLGIGR